jgi:hypothetical protein
MRRYFLYLVVPALLLAGCAGGADGPPVASADFCGAFADAICAGSSSCCAAQPYPSSAECVTAQKAACEAGVGKTLADPRVGYLPRRAGGLLERLRGERASCPLRALSYPDLAAITEGTGAPTADCTPRDAGAGELALVTLSCRREATCRLYLRGSGELQGVCERPGGDDCSHAFDCPAERWCNLPKGWRPGLWGTCQPLRSAGWTCAGDAECQGAYCDPMTKACRAREPAVCGGADGGDGGGGPAGSDGG